ncbi:16S rRNA (uracil(1498)-N(3))-methyltransferase [Treponema sp.]|uniref:RsmE family RNA methyltransferase n=1 Tax=Treponema sp. TaxID=166 RepID=UPI00298DED18|nr:16S rRNA (uracil(1498)-N(3))-methyltransferase [Treponema sp.]MCQ2241162.1 16S rRNA (uracil(1498)-N(3))-methyltransferase [Treponema sp.]
MRQFVADDGLEKGCLYVEGKKFRYLNSVLRVEEGDMIDVRLPGGILQPMTIAKIDRSAKKITIQVAGDEVAEDAFGVHARAAAKELFPYEIWLFQFAAKPPKMDLIIRQAVECGVAKIIPVEGVFCQKGNIESARKKSGGGDDRWQRIVTEAREQSGSPVETEILPCVTVEEACAMAESLGEEKSAVVLYERSDETVSVKEALENCSGAKKVLLAVGAEGGISPEEIGLLKKSGFYAVHIKTNILRCETAALYGVAAVQTVMDREE